ncbi:hypothetical protein ACFQZU_09070 [Streptomonospora algeriensis]|uniref:Uncharacterized protein n=1 Tax=Streptomonospora algeriensis TaxID=995084 RepID=A0ABW3BDQ3_9ACTN
MKFELVDPAERPAEDGVEAPGDGGIRPSARIGDEAPETGADEGVEHAEAEETGEAGEETEAERDPEARLRASTRRLAAQARQGAALVGDSLAKLAHQVAELEVADTGHRAAPPPSGFRADRFSAARHNGGAGAGVVASCARPAPAAPDAEVANTMEPGVHRKRPSTDDRR